MRNQLRREFLPQPIQCLPMISAFFDCEGDAYVTHISFQEFEVWRSLSIATPSAIEESLKQKNQ
jgi:hypothetical protein